MGSVQGKLLDTFTPQVREWFTRSFEEPTAAQAKAWPAIARGENVLLSAPTGSGKTLAAFLWGLDRLVAEPADGDRLRLVYVSPLKALSYDVERNLRAPLRGIGGELSVANDAFGMLLARLGAHALQAPVTKVPVEPMSIASNPRL